MVNSVLEGFIMPTFARRTAHGDTAQMSSSVLQELSAYGICKKINLVMDNRIQCLLFVTEQISCVCSQHA